MKLRYFSYWSIWTILAIGVAIILGNYMPNEGWTYWLFLILIIILVIIYIFISGLIFSLYYVGSHKDELYNFFKGIWDYYSQLLDDFLKKIYGA